MLKKMLSILLAVVCLMSVLSSTALASSVGKKTTTRKLDDWYISNDGKYGIAVFGPDKCYDGSYSVTIYIKHLPSGQIVTSTDFEVLDAEEEIEWRSLATQYGHRFIGFALPDDTAISEFYYEGNKKYSFKVNVLVQITGLSDITAVRSASFTAP